MKRNSNCSRLFLNPIEYFLFSKSHDISGLGTLQARDQELESKNVSTKKFMKITVVVLATLAFFQVFAADTIQITVIASDKAAAVGFLVDGKKTGGIGHTYSAKGPVNKAYFFGYRKRVIGGTDIPCGTLILNKNSKVQLVTNGDQCYSVLN